MDNITKIRHVSTILIYGCYAMMLLCVGWIYGTLFNVFTGRDALGDYMHDAYIPTLLRMGEADLLLSIPSAAIYFLPTMVLIYALWRLSKMFRLYRDGEYFCSEGANHLYVFALLFCLMHILGTPLLGVADYVLTLGNDLKPYGMPLRINGDEILLLMLYATFLIVSWILREAIKIAEENKEFV